MAHGSKLIASFVLFEIPSLVHSEKESVEGPLISLIQIDENE